MSDWANVFDALAAGSQGLREGRDAAEVKRKQDEEDARQKAQWDFEMEQARITAKRQEELYGMDKTRFEQEQQDREQAKKLEPFNRHIAAGGTVQSFFSGDIDEYTKQQTAEALGIGNAPQPTITETKETSENPIYSQFASLFGNGTDKELEYLKPFLGKSATATDQMNSNIPLASVGAGGEMSLKDVVRSLYAKAPDENYKRVLNNLLKQGAFTTEQPPQYTDIVKTISTPPLAEGLTNAGGYAIPIDYQALAAKQAYEGANMQNLSGTLSLIRDTDWTMLPEGTLAYAADTITQNTGLKVTEEDLKSASWASKHADTFGKPAELLGTMQALGMFYALGATNIADEVAKESGLSADDIAMVKRQPMVWAMMGTFSGGGSGGGHKGGGKGKGTGTKTAGLTDDQKMSMARGKAIDDMFNKTKGVAYSPTGGTQMFDPYTYIEQTTPPEFVDQAKQDWKNYKYGIKPATAPSKPTSTAGSTPAPTPNDEDLIDQIVADVSPW